MRTIWKYELPARGKFCLKLSLRYQILSFGNQDGRPVLWVLHEVDNPTKEVEFRIIATGEEIEEECEDLKYISTAMFQNEAFVFHLFQIIDHNYEES